MVTYMRWEDKFRIGLQGNDEAVVHFVHSLEVWGDFTDIKHGYKLQKKKIFPVSLTTVGFFEKKTRCYNLETIQQLK